MSRAPSLDLRVWVHEAVPGGLSRRLAAARLGVNVAVSAAVADGHAMRANNTVPDIKTANVQGFRLWLEGIVPSSGRVASSADVISNCARDLRVPGADLGDRLEVRGPTYDATTISVGWRQPPSRQNRVPARQAATGDETTPADTVFKDCRGMATCRCPTLVVEVARGHAMAVEHPGQVIRRCHSRSLRARCRRVTGPRCRADD